MSSHSHTSDPNIQQRSSSNTGILVHARKSFLERFSYWTVLDEEGHKHLSLRRVALSLAITANIAIFLTKIYAYAISRSLSVLAALIESALDFLSQIVLFYADKRSSRIQRSSEYYPAGASRLEPVGVLLVAAITGMASFYVIKDSIMDLIYKNNEINTELKSVWGMIGIVVTKLSLFIFSRWASREVSGDPTIDALAKDHINDAFSNAIAAIALTTAIYIPSLWFLDPIGAIFISSWIIYTWSSTGKEQIGQLTGRVAPEAFIEEMRNLAANFDDRVVCVSVCRAYNFGPKFLVELDIVLPRDTPLCESHDLGMDLQYEIEGKDEVERCFVHIDYEARTYDEHVISKSVELRERIRESSSTLTTNSDEDPPV